MGGDPKEGLGLDVATGADSREVAWAESDLRVDSGVDWDAGGLRKDSESDPETGAGLRK